MPREAPEEEKETTPLGSEKELRRLQALFHDEEGRPKDLSLEQFVRALSPAGIWRESELATLFKKIDASGTETVSWEEVTNYVLLNMRDVGIEHCGELSTNCEALAGVWSASHGNMINSIVVIPDYGGGRRYATAGRDGLVKVWQPNLTLQKAVDVGNRGSWLSAACWMGQSRHLAVASSNFKVFFHDAAFGPVAHMVHSDGTPLCMAYTDLEASCESDGRAREFLMIGDDKGGVTVYCMDEDWFGDEGGEALKFRQKPLRQQYHSDWVTKVGFVPELQAMVTCGLDGEINLCDLQLNKRKGGREAVRLHRKGVHSWCWCKSYKWFASGGLDRQVVVWNPYTQRAITSLPGHNAPIIDLLVNERQNQLVSLAIDKVVRVWDIRNYRCMQTFTDKTEYRPENRLTCMALDEDAPALVLCSSSLNVLPVSVRVETARTHLSAIVDALYNDVFHQIVSGDAAGTVCVWDVRSGRLEVEIRRAHQDSKLTCMALDESKRRLYTGAEDGVVKLWNFSSGQQLRSYTMARPVELTSILWAREGRLLFLLGLSADGRIHVWPEKSRNVVEAQYVLEDSSGSGHRGDVTCICRHSSVNGLLATGGEEGCVVLWKISDSSSPRRCTLADSGPCLPPIEPPPPEYPKELGFKERREGKRGAELMLCLEQKGWLLTVHGDGFLRLWSAQAPEFLQRFEMEGNVTGLHAAESLLFTGGEEGSVRVWDLEALPRALKALGKWRPHQQAVTKLQYFELDGCKVVMSASADCTIALCSLDGERIGTFSGKGPCWRLAESKAWCRAPPRLDDALEEEEDGFSFTPRRPPGTAAGARPRQLRMRPSAAEKASCRAHLQLNAQGCKPDLSLVEKERQWLRRHEAGRLLPALLSPVSPGV